MDRRGFLKAILAAGVAPYVITTAGVLMPVKKLAIVENPLFKGELGTWTGVTLRIDYMLPLRSIGVSGSSALIGNEERLSIYSLQATVPKLEVGDSFIVGKLPYGAKIINSNYPIDVGSDNVLRLANGA